MQETQTKLINRAAYQAHGFVEVSEPLSIYNGHAWALREQEYIAAISSIVLPYQMSADDLEALNAIIDHTYTIALIEDAMIRREFEIIQVELKSRPISMFNHVKNALETQEPQKSRWTEAEVNAEIHTRLRTEPYDSSSGNTDTIYDLYYTYKKCVIFINAIITALKDKQQKLITNAAAMKILSDKPNMYPMQIAQPMQPIQTTDHTTVRINDDYTVPYQQYIY